MKRNVVETVLGAVVLVVAIVFLGFSYSSANVGDIDGYEITADFSGTGGLSLGDDVQISGVKIGTVSKIELKPDDYRARVTMEVNDDIKLPDDSAAFISSESLLGGKYMELQPGSSEEILGKGGHIQYTQAPQNLEQLLGKFIFSMDKGKNGEGDAVATSPQAGDAPPNQSAPFLQLQTEPQGAPAQQ
jgi:phospholipid/cholesterol/gamma-HCH transport system substrate-binding protein